MYRLGVRMVGNSDAASTVIAGLDPAIQQAIKIFASFMDGPITPGHDN